MFVTVVLHGQALKQMNDAHIHGTSILILCLSKDINKHQNRDISRIIEVVSLPIRFLRQ